MNLRFISGSVIVRGSPWFFCFSQVSQTLPRVSITFTILRTAFNLNSPNSLESNTTIFSPFEAKFSTRIEPMLPAPPLIKIKFVSYWHTNFYHNTFYMFPSYSEGSPQAHIVCNAQKLLTI